MLMKGNVENVSINENIYHNIKNYLLNIYYNLLLFINIIKFLS